jgi:hypothetical protein
VVQIGGEAAASRTALPSEAPSVESYNINVYRGLTLLGSSADVKGWGPFPVSLSDAPATGDIVSVEGLDSGKIKSAEGSYTLPADYASGTTVAITLYPLSGGTGTVELSVNFDPGSGDDQITKAELSLYTSLADYKTGVTPYDFVNHTFAGEDTKTIPIKYDALPSGNYVVKIDFFRGSSPSFIRVSRLAQTIIVRGGLTTNTWVGGDSGLSWNVFASSKAELADEGEGIEINGTPIAGYAPSTYNYAEYVSISADLPASVDLTVKVGETGQTITASLNNGAPVPLTSGVASSLSPLEAANSIVITVTAPDGATSRTYTVAYTCEYAEGWYVSEGGNDSGEGSSSSPFASVSKALEKISGIYNKGASWPGSPSNPVAARINISGTISATGSGSYFDDNNGMIHVDGSAATGLPPIILAGTDSSTDKIQNSGNRRVLYITNNATVILGDGLTFTGGTASDGGGGVYIVNGSFTMNGGNITGNTATGKGGGGVYVAGGAFTMNGGTISGNTATGSGAGVYFSGGSFSMSGAALINTDNDVYLPDNKKITIAGNLTATPPVARITPQTYAADTQVLDGTHIAGNYGKFTVTPNGGDNWTITSSGKLAQQP